MLALAHGVSINNIVTFVNNKLGVDGGTVYAILIRHENCHGACVGAGGCVEVGQMHSLLVAGAVAKVPHHAVTGVIDGGVKGDFLVGTEIVVF